MADENFSELLKNVPDLEEGEQTDEHDTGDTADTPNEDAESQDEVSEPPAERKVLSTKGSSKGVDKGKKAASPKDLLDASGNVVARGGPERRLYEQLQSTRTQVADVTSKLKEANAKLQAFESSGSVGQQLGLTPVEVINGSKLAAALKQNPIETVKFLLTQLQAAGHNVDSIAGGHTDVNAIKSIIEQSLKPFRDRFESQNKVDEATRRGQEEYGRFVAKYPDAELHGDSIAQLLREDNDLTPDAAYFKLRMFYTENGLDWSKPLEQIEQELNKQKRPSSLTRRPIPGRGSSGANVEDADDVVHADTSIDDIIRSAMKEVSS